MPHEPKQHPPKTTKNISFALLCSCSIFFCGNETCDSIGEYNSADLSSHKDMNPDTPNTDTPKDTDAHDTGNKNNDSQDMPKDMPKTNNCEFVTDCETGQEHVIASCSSTGLCSYQCTDENWAVTDGESISTEGCTCTVNEEICDNRDNDCDTQIDEGLVRLCENQKGVCAGSNRVCQGDSIVFEKECTKDDYENHNNNFTDNFEEDFRCDQLDNNCDGATDPICCTKLPHPESSSKITAEGFTYHSYAAFITFDPDGESDLNLNIFQYGESNNLTTLQKEPLTNASLTFPEPNSNTLPSFTSCVRQGDLELAVTRPNTAHYHTVETCIENREELKSILITSSPAVIAPNELQLKKTLALWKQPKTDNTEISKLTSITSNQNHTLIAAWDFSNSTAKLQWCLSGNPAQDCNTTDVEQEITVTQPLKPEVALSSGSKGIISFIETTSNNLADESKLIEVSPFGNYTSKSKVTLPSTTGGNRILLDHEIIWLDEDLVFVAHLVHHSDAQIYKIYTGIHSTSQKTNIATRDFSFNPTQSSSIEFEVIATQEHINILLLHSGAVHSQVLDRQLNEIKNKNIIQASASAGRLRLQPYQNLLTLTYADDFEQTDSNTAKTHIISKEGIPICEFEPSTLEMTMP